MPTATQCAFCELIRGAGEASVCYEDSTAIAFMDIQPVNPGHVLVAPRRHFESLEDLPADLATHLFQVAQTIGQAQMAAVSARRIGMMIVGDEVPHVHLHVVPFDSVSELSFAHADPNPPEGSLEDAAAKIRAALRDLGAVAVSE